MNISNLDSCCKTERGFCEWFSCEQKTLFFSKIHLHQLVIHAQLQWPKQEKTEHNYAFYFLFQGLILLLASGLHLVSSPHNITNDFPWYLIAKICTISHFNPAANNSSLDFTTFQKYIHLISPLKVWKKLSKFKIKTYKIEKKISMLSKYFNNQTQNLKSIRETMFWK